jgi:hypothetical protein
MKPHAGGDETTGEIYTAWKKAPPHTHLDGRAPPPQ